MFGQLIFFQKLYSKVHGKSISLLLFTIVEKKGKILKNGKKRVKISL